MLRRVWCHKYLSGVLRNLCTYRQSEVQHLCGERTFIAYRCILKRHNSSGRIKSVNWSRVTAGVCVSLGVGIGFSYYISHRLRTSISKVPSVYAAEVFDPGMDGSVIATPPPSATKQYNFIADVVEKAAPAVVYIEIQTRHPVFGERPVAVYNGSGFVVKSDGLILTNAHVVANMKAVTVKLHDGRVFEGAVRYVDRNADLATVKINAKNLPVLKMGTSLKVRPGEWVVAMGSPLSLSNTITAGVVSSINRGSKELGLRKEMEYIQTDAAINFGNSGGPLVNLDGEVVGINTLKVTTGISFAIPVDYAKDFLNQAEKLETGKGKSWFGRESQTKLPRKHYIGVTMLTLNPNLILELQQRSPDFPLVKNGVLIWKVIVGSPAHWSGIQPGDVITEINSKPVNSVDDVYIALESFSSIVMTVQRKRETLKLTVTPQETE